MPGNSTSARGSMIRRATWDVWCWSGEVCGAANAGSLWLRGCCHARALAREGTWLGALTLSELGQTRTPWTLQASEQGTARLLGTQ